jgi:diguanylate cyclase (GGDEF)-like protein
VAMLFIDLDDFKAVNDGLGHSAGDALLVAVAGRLRDCLRPQDTVARLGGDEFAVLLERVDVRAAQDVAEMILEVLAAPVLLGTHEYQPRSSVGVAMAAANVGAEELMRNADVAMYSAKEHGKAGYRTFAPAMVEGNGERLQLIAELQRAVEGGCLEFELHYQPIFELRTGTMTGVEALARWRHPERGLVSPAEFIPLAEQTGLIVPLGRRLLAEACRYVRTLAAPQDGRAEVGLSVNVSGAQLHDPRLVDHVAEALAASGLDPGLLTLELTETMLVDDLQPSVARLHDLKALGVRLALDDFGTGYSSLGYLRHFPMDVLKVDKSFIDGVADPAADAHGLMRSIIGLGHTLGLTVVAEGVEDSGQLEQLRHLGCDLGQGFLLARPMTREALARYFARSPNLVAAMDDR